MVKESTIGKMEECIKDNGWIIICMDRGIIAGQMEGIIKGCISMIKNMGMVFINGLTEDALKEAGIKGNNMAMDDTYKQ